MADRLFDLISQPWPWYVAGPLIGLFVPALLLLGNRQFGVSSNLRHLCAAVVPGNVEFFRYDWKHAGMWNLVFLSGVLAGGFIGARVFGAGEVTITPGTAAMLTQLGIHDFAGLAPRELFSWSAFLTLRGATSIVGGGLLVGFGTAYAGGCTSGHAISGLAAFERASLVAVIGFFTGGLLATHAILPLLF
ncbi:MAG: YeeE/YedE thiosulfate transporter family protein [Acidobacteria bacterium]|nr:YeeE/YedE thiosulfate transporter family protein [Acidobacteriota bacterium]